MKVLSLLPSATEIVYALGAEELLCGVSCDCDYPPEVSTKPVVSSTRLPITSQTSPGEIDRLVSTQLHETDSIYELNRELIQRLRPDLILAQDLCRVCAVPSGDVEEALDTIGCTSDVISLEPSTLEDVLASIKRVGNALGIPDRSDALVRKLNSRLDTVRTLTEDCPRPRVVALEWQDPPFNGGHWIPEMIELAGGTDVLGAPGVRSRRLAWSEIREAAPEVIVYMPCGYGLKEAVDQIGSLFSVAEFVATPAVLDGEVYATDSSAYFSRSGPRLVDGVEILAGLLHPERVGAADPTKAVRVNPPMLP